MSAWFGTKRPWVQVPPLRPRRTGLCSVPIFVCTKIGHTRRRSSFSEKGHGKSLGSLVNAFAFAWLPTNLFRFAPSALVKSYNATRTKEQDRPYGLACSFLFLVGLEAYPDNSNVLCAFLFVFAVLSQIVALFRLLFALCLRFFSQFSFLHTVFLKPAVILFRCLYSQEFSLRF